MTARPRYRVTGALATVSTFSDVVTSSLPGIRGMTRVTIFNDGLLPDDVPQHHIDHLLSINMIAAVPS